MVRIIFITGTDTGVGKTVLTTLLVRHLRDRDLPIAALKPICSGGRDDAKALHAALGGALTLDEINPWHFRAPQAPVLAARKENRVVTQAEVVAHARQFIHRFEIVLVEGAGGLLSPLGEGFDSRSLIAAWRAQPIVVAANRLGAVNQVRLVLAALPTSAARGAQVVLMSPQQTDDASASNPLLLGEFVKEENIHVLPWLRPAEVSGRKALPAAARRVLDKLV